MPLVACAIRPCYQAWLLAFFFAAVHQASADDTAAVQNAINNCPFGGTVTFPVGTYRIGSPLSLKANCTYQGQGNPVFMGYQGNGPGGYVIAQIHQRIQSIVITGITFDGGGLFFGANDQKGSDVTVTNNVFRHIQNTNDWNDVAHLAIYMNGYGFGHVNITNNVFQDITYGNDNYNTDWITAINGDWGSSAVSVELADSYDINDNTFRNIGSNAIKMPPNRSPTPHPGPYNILRNNFYQVHRMPIENQEGYTGFCVNNLKIDNNVLHSFVSPYWDTMGISAMPWCAVNSEVSHNQIYLSPKGPAVPENHGKGDFNYGLGIEMGLNRADGNVIQSTAGDPGPAWFMSIAISGAVISNNVICGPTKNSLWYGYDSKGDPNKLPATFTNNTYTATCPSMTTPSITPGSSLPGRGVVSDEFNTKPLNSSLWTLVAPAGGSQSTTGTAVRLTAPAGSTHDPNDVSTNNAVRLEQNVGNVDFNVVVKFTSLPSRYVNSRNAEGLMVSGDASNFMRFEVSSNQAAGYQIYASSTVAGVQGKPFIDAVLPVTAGPFYLRVARAGNVWTESWSTDGVSYTTSGTFTQVMATAKIGPYVTNYATTAAATPLNVATVDFFRSLPLKRAEIGKRLGPQLPRRPRDSPALLSDAPFPEPALR